jgi:hypothetical protein
MASGLRQQVTFSFFVAVFRPAGRKTATKTMMLPLCRRPKMPAA